MKKTTILGISKLRLISLILFVALFAYPIATYATGWESVFRGSATCGGSGTAHTVEREVFYLFGVAWMERTTYRDGNNNTIANTCEDDGPGN